MQFQEVLVARAAGELAKVEQREYERSAVSSFVAATSFCAMAPAGAITTIHSQVSIVDNVLGDWSGEHFRRKLQELASALLFFAIFLAPYTV